MFERPTAEAGFAETMTGVVADFGAEAIDGRAVIAVAGNVTDGRAHLTNADWDIDVAEVSALLGDADVALINDFEAIAHGLPLLRQHGCRVLNSGVTEAGAPMLVLGPGTGFGVAATVPNGDGYRVIAGEGGHVTLAGRTGEEDAIVRRMRARFPHVSAERIISGIGLETLHDVRCGIKMDAATIGKAARAGIPDALATVHVFTAFFATVAADAALTFGAKGGVFLAGGVLSGLGEAFEPARFMKRFADKGRFSNYLADIPVHHITHPQPGLLGLTTLR